MVILFFNYNEAGSKVRHNFTDHLHTENVLHSEPLNLLWGILTAP